MSSTGLDRLRCDRRPHPVSLTRLQDPPGDRVCARRPGLLTGASVDADPAGARSRAHAPPRELRGRRTGLPPSRQPAPASDPLPLPEHRPRSCCPRIGRSRARPHRRAIARTSRRPETRSIRRGDEDENESRERRPGVAGVTRATAEAHTGARAPVPTEAPRRRRGPTLPRAVRTFRAPAGAPGSAASGAARVAAAGWRPAASARCAGRRRRGGSRTRRRVTCGSSGARACCGPAQ